jgi:hypothetical protein
VAGGSSGRKKDWRRVWMEAKSLVAEKLSGERCEGDVKEGVKESLGTERRSR